MILWMKVSKDKYSLPEAVADSPRELGKLIGIKGKSIIEKMCRDKKRGRKERYIKVEVPDKDE